MKVKDNSYLAKKQLFQKIYNTLYLFSGVGYGRLRIGKIARSMKWEK